MELNNVRARLLGGGVKRGVNCQGVPQRLPHRLECLVGDVVAVGVGAGNLGCQVLQIGSVGQQGAGRGNDEGF